MSRLRSSGARGRTPCRTDVPVEPPAGQQTSTTNPNLVSGPSADTPPVSKRQTPPAQPTSPLLAAVASATTSAPASSPAELRHSHLRGSNLHLSFGAHTVVHDACLNLPPGQVTALVGPNGSGKSTVLRALARLHPIASGEVALSDVQDPQRAMHAVSTLSARRFAQQVTLFAQTRTAPHGLSVREVVAFGRHPYRRRFAGLSAADHAAVEVALHVTGVHSLAERAAAELSGGELQRVWLAACLAQETGVVLLDEPTNHLDLRYQVETLDLIRDLAVVRGAAVGVVLHDLDHAARIADRLLLMAAGRVVATGTPVDVLTAENISAAYGLRVEVHFDQRTQRLRIDPISRHQPSTTMSGHP